jgi:RNA polymerase sigma-70 factor (ECF subfamily)
MGSNDEYTDLVERARRGDEDCMNRLAERARERLRMYVRRLTLDDDVTQDILQESMLEMFRFLDKLERADRFWPWLFRIATRNFHDQHEREQRRRRLSPHEGEDRNTRKREERQEGLENLVSQELRQVVSAAMLRLKPQYRTVLTLRCFEEMPYSEISEVVGCSEFGARMRFLRAKKALARQLSRGGFGKKSLLVALVIYGKMTATSEAAAANVSVTSATMKAGLAASLTAMATSKTALVGLAAGGLFAAGSIVATPAANNAEPGLRRPEAAGFFDTTRHVEVDRNGQECWYYYPPRAGGAVMIWLKSSAEARHSYCQWLQNDQANYYRTEDTIYINNYRIWNDDLFVRRLPTDGPQMREFLSSVEGRTEQMDYVPGNRDGLLVIVRRDKSGTRSQITQRYDVSDEEYFRYNRPGGAKIIDNRDVMHKRGWTYFRVAGRINEQDIWGVGRISFVHAGSGLYYPWLRLRVGEALRIEDSGSEACVYEQSGRRLARYEGGSFFKGLGRPWMGLHAIDTVRRDAARERIWFETEMLPGGDRGRVTLTSGQTRLVYTINMEKDIVERVSFSTGGIERGELTFSYLEQIEQEGTLDEFVPPTQRTSGRRNRLPGLWLMGLAEGKLGGAG